MRRRILSSPGGARQPDRQSSDSYDLKIYSATNATSLCQSVNLSSKSVFSCSKWPWTSYRPIKCIYTQSCHSYSISHKKKRRRHTCISLVSICVFPFGSGEIIILGSILMDRKALHSVCVHCWGDCTTGPHNPSNSSSSPSLPPNKPILKKESNHHRITSAGDTSDQVSDAPAPGSSRNYRASRFSPSLAAQARYK